MLKCKIGFQSFFRDLGKKSSGAWLGLLIFTLLLLMLSVLGLDLSDRDSPRVAGIAREMAVTSNYLIPRLNGEDFLEYPPLGYWPTAAILSLSQTPIAFLALIPGIFFGAGTVLITYLIGKTLAAERIGLMAGFILSTMSGFMSIHRYCRVDPVLLFFITLSLYGFVSAYQASTKRFLFFSLFYLAMAGAFLSKGIIGVAIPAATVAVFLITQKDSKAIVRLLLNPALLFFILPSLLWVGSVWWLEGRGIFNEVIRQSFWRFLSPAADHAQPLYYYFIYAFVFPLPWTPLLLFLFRYPWNPINSRATLPHGSLLKFALIWSLTILVGLTIASAKRRLYLGPILPPFALLAALGWDRLRETFPGVKRRELYGLVAIFFIYIGAYHVFIIPSQNKQGFRPVFEAVSSQRSNGPVYLVRPSETLRGASFFYLGKRIPVLSTRDVLLRQFENSPGTTFVTDNHRVDVLLVSDVQLKGYRLMLKQAFEKDYVCVYSNGP